MKNSLYVQRSPTWNKRTDTVRVETIANGARFEDISGNICVKRGWLRDNESTGVVVGHHEDDGSADFYCHDATVLPL